MKKIVFLSVIVVALLCSCGSSDDDQVEEKITPTSIIGHTYSAMYFNDCVIYKFNSDGSLSIEERSGSEEGTLKDSSVGKYSVSGLTLNLDIPSMKGCDDCFNYFTATISSDYRSFTYKIVGDYTMNFKIIK